MMSVQARINLGEYAAALMADPAYARAVEMYKAELFQEWLKADDLSAREKLWLECQALEGVTARLGRIRQDGAVAKKSRT